MWTTKHTAETELTVEEVWRALVAIHRGEVVAPGGDVFELEGPLEVGAELSVTPAGQDTFRSRVIELHDSEVYADRTEFGDVVLVFRHTLEALPNGARVTHELVIDGSGADETGPVLGPQISDDFPEAMEGLFQVAAELSQQTPS